ncbi:MAG: hypothetical protein ABR991_08675 [Terracidiphilus sp.]
MRYLHSAGIEEGFQPPMMWAGGAFGIPQILPENIHFFPFVSMKIAESVCRIMAESLASVKLATDQFGKANKAEGF